MWDYWPSAGAKRFLCRDDVGNRGKGVQGDSILSRGPYLFSPEMDAGGVRRCVLDRRHVPRRARGGDDISVSACGYNHLLPEQVKLTRGTYNWLHDKATGCNFMTFGCGAPCLNLYRLEDIPELMRKVVGCEFLVHATHEEYWYKDYFAYQPDSKAKLLASAKVVHDAGYEYFFIEDKINW